MNYCDIFKFIIFVQGQSLCLFALGAQNLDKPLTLRKRTAIVVRSSCLCIESMLTLRTASQSSRSSRSLQEVPSYLYKREFFKVISEMA